MIANVEKRDGSFEQQDREPECNKDFCERCGDCLVCYGGEPCAESQGDKHVWVIYLHQ